MLLEKPLQLSTMRWSKENSKKDIMALSKETILFSYEEYTVYCTTSDQIPNLLLEIGYLRHIAFSNMKAFNGGQLDLDIYDDHYHHLFIWNNSVHEVVGAYRLGLIDFILKKAGPEGFYSNSLFDIDPVFFEKLGGAIELGRTFVHPNYQKNYAPLLLLLKGIGTLTSQNPWYRYLFGLISINQSFSHASQYAIYKYFINQVGLSPLSNHVKPRHYPTFLKQKTEPDEKQLTLKELNRQIQENEGGLSLPVLIREYLKFDIKFLTCNIDSAFGSCLDLFCVVDLACTNTKILSRYMGLRTHSFLDFHKVSNCS